MDVNDMKVLFEQKTSSGYLEGSIKLINNSNQMLQNISLSFDTLSHNLVECKIVRERGSLCFGPPNQTIELGNLYPEEIAYCYCKMPLPSHSNLLTPNYLEQIKLTFCPENSELTTHLLSELLHGSLTSD